MGRHYSSSIVSRCVLHILVASLLLDVVCRPPSLAECSPFKLDQESILDSLRARDRQRKQDSDRESPDKRSLSSKPFEEMYLGTRSHVLEVLEDGRVRGSTIPEPEYGE